MTAAAATIGACFELCLGRSDDPDLVVTLALFRSLAPTDLSLAFASCYPPPPLPLACPALLACFEAALGAQAAAKTSFPRESFVDQPP